MREAGLRTYLPELFALPLLPLLHAQGRRARRATPRLLEAAGPCSGVAGRAHVAPPLSLLGIGESPVAGVGVGRHDEAISGQLAALLSQRLQRPVHWAAYGKNGATIADARRDLLPSIPPQPVDLVLVAFGVNDTSSFRPVAQWRASLTMLLAELHVRCTPHLILVSGVPPVGRFPALPQPLRWILGLKASALDAAALAIANETPRTRHVPLSLDVHDRSLVASDGYHPSAAGCVAWATLLAEAAAATFETDRSQPPDRRT